MADFSPGHPRPSVSEWMNFSDRQMLRLASAKVFLADQEFAFCWNEFASDGGNFSSGQKS